MEISPGTACRAIRFEGSQSCFHLSCFVVVSHVLCAHHISTLVRSPAGILHSMLGQILGIDFDSLLVRSLYPHLKMFQVLSFFLGPREGSF